MTDTAINPVAPSRALARNEPTRAFAPKQLESYSAFTSEQSIAGITPHRSASSTPHPVLEKMICEPESPIQIP
jgi:hypothetical protein